MRWEWLDQEKATFYFAAKRVAQNNKCMEISTGDLVLTSVDRNETSTRKNKLRYWVGQVGPMRESSEGIMEFFIRFLDDPKCYLGKNKTARVTFEHGEMLETENGFWNPLLIIEKKLKWATSSSEIDFDDFGFPKTVFSERLWKKTSKDLIHVQPCDRFARLQSCCKDNNIFIDLKTEFLSPGNSSRSIDSFATPLSRGHISSHSNETAIESPAFKKHKHDTQSWTLPEEYKSLSNDERLQVAQHCLVISMMLLISVIQTDHPSASIHNK